MADRHLAVRAALEALGIEAFLVPRGDEHLGEYVPPRAERLAWLTGFTGSAGLAIVTPASAALFTDGRYWLQLAAQVDLDAFTRHHLTEDPPAAWLARHAKRAGYDPWLLSEEQVARYEAAGVTMVPLAANPIDALWQDRPAPPAGIAVPHSLNYAGMSSADKLAGLCRTLNDAGQGACVLTDTASVNWLFNIRGEDIPFIPVAMGYAIVHATGSTDLFIDPAKLPAETVAWLPKGVTCRPVSDLRAALSGLSGRVRVDRAGAPAAVAQAVRAGGGVVVDGSDPCLLPKACKNPVEQAGSRAAHRRDAAALCRFLHWFSTATGETELSAAAQLLALRAGGQDFRGESFPAISAAGEHGAIIHYRVSASTNRAIGRNEVYLIDSGAQYLDGTTDVTRTLWTGPDAPPESLRRRFTAVLQGHIALAETVFPQGVAGPHLDAVARRPLWRDGLDYDHGTGHGVGSYLSVHEGPCSLSRAARPVPIGAGMILSDEPGFYAPGEYGIRLENLLLAEQYPVAGERTFLAFETLTLAPFDRALIDSAMLSASERQWLDRYHARVLAEVGPALDPADRQWLTAACAPLP